VLQVRVTVGEPTELEREALLLAGAEESERFVGSVAKANQRLNGYLRKLREWGEVKGKLGEVTVLHTLGLMPPRRVVLVGVGKRQELEAEKVRRAIGNAVRNLNRIGVKRAAIALDSFPSEQLDAETLGRAIAEGALLANYRYLRKSTNEEAPTLEALELVTPYRRQAAALEKRGAVGDGHGNRHQLCSRFSQHARFRDDPNCPCRTSKDGRRTASVAMRNLRRTLD